MGWVGEWVEEGLLGDGGELGKLLIVLMLDTTTTT